MVMGGNGNRGHGKNGNGNDSIAVGREWEQESHFRTPLVSSQHNCRAFCLTEV